MKRDENQIERIAAEVKFIEAHTQNTTEEDFLNNDLLQHAVMMSIITIGECANHLSDKFKLKHSHIEWEQITAVRNIAAHGYWQLNMKQIWQALIEDIPVLSSFIKDVLE